MSYMPPVRPDDRIEEILNKRHASYNAKASLFKYLYYTSRVLAGLSATLLPFIVAYSQILASALAAIVAVVTVLDTIFTPGEKWKNYSIASDRLWVAQIRERGEFEKYKDRIEEILKAESKNVEFLTSLQEMLDQIQKQQHLTPKEQRTKSRPRAQSKKETLPGASQPGSSSSTKSPPSDE